MKLRIKGVDELNEFVTSSFAKKEKKEVNPEQLMADMYYEIMCKVGYIRPEEFEAMPWSWAYSIIKRIWKEWETMNKARKNGSKG